MAHFLSSGQLLVIAEDARLHAERKNRLALASIVFSAASVEGIFSEFALLCERSGTGTPAADAMSRYHQVASGRAFERAGIVEKVRLYYRALGAGPPEFGTPPLQALCDLALLRNYIMHLKPEEATVLEGEDALDSQARKIVGCLAQAGVIPRPAPRSGGALTGFLSHPGAAGWACETALAARRHLAELLPGRTARRIALMMARRRDGSAPPDS